MSVYSRLSLLAIEVRNTFNKVIPRLIPKGGQVGQVLAKKGASDYDVAWKDDETGPIDIQEVIGLAEALAGKADDDHSHDIEAVDGLEEELAEVNASVQSKEPLIISGSANAYLRGDKTWAILDKAAIGLANVDNTSDLNKPVSHATQAAITGAVAGLNFSVSDIGGLTAALAGKLDDNQASPFGLSILALANSPAARTLFGLGSAAQYEAYDFAPANHTHDLASTTAAGLMSGADKAKLNNIAPNASANSTDAQLRDRASHTGLQAISTITGLDTALTAKLDASTISTFGLSLAAAADPVAARSLLSLGSAALAAASSFAAAAHTHTISDVLDLQSALNLLAPLDQPAFTNGISVGGSVTSTGEHYIGNNKVWHSGDAVNAATLNGLAASSYSLSDHAHPEFLSLSTTLAGKEPVIVSGTTAQYWRGDKTWQTLDALSVGLGYVDNTSDLNKPISVATQSALDLKAGLSNPSFSGTPRVATHKIFHEGNDGPDSGLDADTLHGLRPVDFASADHTHFYAPILHTHSIVDVDGLQTSLAAKAPLSNPVFAGSVTLASDPSNPYHAATKQYVDSLVQGLRVKQPVACVALTDIALSGVISVDGVQTVDGMRVLATGQSNAAENGIYVAKAEAWERAEDFDVWSEIPAGFTFVSGGDDHANTGWICTAPSSGTLGTTTISWSQFSGQGSYKATGGIQQTGTTFSLSPMAPFTVKGNVGSAIGPATDLSAEEVTSLLSLFDASSKGLVPASNGSAFSFLRGDGQWAAPALAWGQITGSISAQTDLAAELANRAPINSPTFVGNVAIGGSLNAGSTSVNHQLGNLVVLNGGSGSPLLRSALESPAILVGSALKFHTDLANKISASSSISTHMTFEVMRGATNGFKWFTAPATNNVLVEQMHLTNQGALGIGTASPSARLHVVGDIRGTGSIIAQGELYSGANKVLHTGDAINAATLGGIAPSGYSRVNHVHTIADITGLQAALDQKLSSAHTHVVSDIGGLQAALDAKEGAFGAGTSAQYLRGDKTWRTLDKSAVGLSNVDNTTDLAKPISAAVQTALDGKFGFTGGQMSGDLFISTPGPILTLCDIDSATNISAYISFANNEGSRQGYVGYGNGNGNNLVVRNDKGDIVLSTGSVVRIGIHSVYHSGNLSASTLGLGNVDNTSDANKPVSVPQQAIFDQKLNASHEGQGGSAHAIATITAAGFMNPEDKIKINGIAIGATANAPDAQLRDRATHTGSQAISTVNGLQSALDGKVGKGAITTSGLTMASQRMLGRGSNTVGEVEEIILGAGLTIANGVLTLSNSGGGAWGEIIGTLSDQADLASALASKQPLSARLTAFAALSGNDTVPYLDNTGALMSAPLTAAGRSILGAANISSIQTLLGFGSKVNVSAIGAPNGVASLDGNGKLPYSQIPAIALNETFVVSSQAAQLALTAQSGDFAVRTDVSLTFVHNGGSSGTMADWTEISSAGGVASVNGLSGAVTLTKEHVVQLASNKILGRWSSGTGVVQEVSIGTGLSLSGGVLSATNTGGSGGGGSGLAFAPITVMGTGTEQTIELPLTGLVADDLLVTVEGLVQDGSDFSINDTLLSLTAPNGAAVTVRRPTATSGIAKKPIYTVAELSSMDASAGQEAHCSNESGGYTPVFSDGVNWRRVYDRQIIS